MNGDTHPGTALERFGCGGARDRAMSLAGFRAGIPRRPLLPLTPGQVEELRQALVEEGLLP